MEKKKRKVVSTQDEAGLATRWVSSAACGSIGTSRRGGGLWHLLLLLLRCRVVRTLCKDTTHSAKDRNGWRGRNR